jgi:nucleoside 2-deoxyribosyltransferase
MGVPTSLDDARTVAFCGSFRFRDRMAEVARQLAARGIECLVPTPVADARQGLMGCFDRIDRADAVMLIDPEGYVGGSVAADLGYAFARGKPIFALEMPVDDALAVLVSGLA